MFTKGSKTSWFALTSNETNKQNFIFIYSCLFFIHSYFHSFIHSCLFFIKQKTNAYTSEKATQSPPEESQGQLQEIVNRFKIQSIYFVFFFVLKKKKHE